MGDFVLDEQLGEQITDVGHYWTTLSAWKSHTRLV
jgi:hypothetical protein